MFRGNILRLGQKRKKKESRHQPATPQARYRHGGAHCAAPVPQWRAGMARNPSLSMVLLATYPINRILALTALTHEGNRPRVRQRS